VPRFLCGRCVVLPGERGGIKGAFAPNMLIKCLFLLHLNGGAGGSRTRVRKSSAFGSTCLAKSFSLIARYPTGREDVQRAQLGFSELALNIPQRDLVRVDPGDLHAQAHVRPRALRQVFKLLVRSCRRWQL